MKKTSLFTLCLGILFLIPAISATTNILYPPYGENLTFGDFSIIVNTTLLEPNTIECWLNLNDNPVISIISQQSILIDGQKTFDINVDTSVIPHNNPPLDFYTLTCMLDQLPEETFQVHGLTILGTIKPIPIPIEMIASSTLLMSSSIIDYTISDVTQRIIVKTPIEVDCSLKKDCNKLYKKALKDYLKGK